ncbi:MAG: kdsA [Chlamydiales bacterium]|jgi:2-dehydro-3-deoxyphosphooctonate aldolase (KDO 8-P synthase)|nr:kdsA [Chlamydiales bacterium]
MKPVLVPIGNLSMGKGQPLTIISGPCVIESEDHCLYTAEAIINSLKGLPVQFVFKASFDKANRLSFHSFRGPGLEEGMRILRRVKEEFQVPVLSDIHEAWQADPVKDVLDIIQIPALLCRQTDLVVAAAKTGKVVSLKKGQFMAPSNMESIAKKCLECGNDKVLLIDRGASFGYNNLVSDFRSIAIMQRFGFPVGYDASHSVQLPGSGAGNTSGGEREFIPLLSRAAVAAGADFLYIESHPNPPSAKSDAATVFDIKGLRALVEQLAQIHAVLGL